MYSAVNLLSVGPVSGPKPHRNRPVLLSHKTVYHTPIYGSQKEDGSTQPGPGWKCGRSHDQVLGVCTGGGAWRNPKPTGGPYVCEQCRLDACGGNDATLTMQAVTTTELAPADVCADCEARLLEELEVKDRA